MAKPDEVDSGAPTPIGKRRQAERKRISTGTTGPGLTRDREILKAAARLFARRGFHAVGVDEIGEAAGVTGPAIYRHFGSKDEILGALFETASSDVLLRMNLNSDDPWERLDGLIRGQVEFSLADPELLAVYALEDRSLVDPWRRVIRRREQEHMERWYRVLTACYPSAAELDLRTAAYAANGMALHIAFWPAELRNHSDAVERAISLVRSALAALEPHGSSKVGTAA